MAIQTVTLIKINASLNLWWLALYN